MLRRPLTGILATAAILVSAGCGSGSEPTSYGSSATPTPTLSRFPRILDPGLSIKSAGSVLAILDQTRVQIRVDSLNQGEQAALNNAVIVLRSSPQRTVFVWTSVGQAIPGPSATSMADLRIGEHVTFAFDQRTEDPSDGSYIAGVVGRSRSGG